MRFSGEFAAFATNVTKLTAGFKSQNLKNQSLKNQSQSLEIKGGL
jgi:hypothetical protein